MKLSVTSIAVVGAKGYVGSQVARAVSSGGRYRLVPIHRGDSPDELMAQADVVIHAANPARRFNAEQDPERDFRETVEKTGSLLAAARGKPFLLVSSLSCRTQINLNYGRHRRACELMVLSAGASIVRLGPMFGGGRTRDVLHDILAGRPVYLSPETNYAYADVEWVGRQIVELVGAAPGIHEIGARNAVRLGDIAGRFGSASSFDGYDDTQIPEDCADGPEADEVFAFAEKEKFRMTEWQ